MELIMSECYYRKNPNANKVNNLDDLNIIVLFKKNAVIQRVLGSVV